MTAAGPVIVQIALSLAAIAGLIVLHNGLIARDPWDPLVRRFVFGIRVTILLFAGRVMLSLTGIAAFRILILLAAALIPLAVLLLTEGLLRRHAPRWIKAVIAGGAVLFAVAALWYSDSIDPFRIQALMAFQLAGFVLAGAMIAMRDRASLTPTENATVTRLGLSLLALVPLAAADYLAPVQLSGLAVLVLCWLATGLGRGTIRIRTLLRRLGLMLALSVALAVLVALIAGMDGTGAVLTGAVVLAAFLLFAVIEDARAIQRETDGLRLLRLLAAAPTDSAEQFLLALRPHPAIEGAVLITDEDTADLSPDVLDRLFARAPVLRRSDPPPGDGDLADHASYLFERYDATHIFAVSQNPRLLVALALPSLGGSVQAEQELALVQRMAALVAEREGRG